MAELKYSTCSLKYSGGRLCGKIRSGFAGSAAALCEKLDAPGTVLCKDRSKVKAAAIDGFFVKRYNLPGFLTQFRRRFKRSRPDRALSGAVALAALGIGTPEVFAALTEKRFFRRREILITAALDEKVKFLPAVCSELPAADAWQLLMDAVVPLVARIHQAQWCHGDLSLRNIYVAPDGTAGFIDLDGMTHYGRVPERVIALEVAKLVSSFMLYTGDVSRQDELTGAALARYREVSGYPLTQKSVENALRPLMVRVHNYLEQKKHEPL